jgi:hypothetical protein
LTIARLEGKLLIRGNRQNFSDFSEIVQGLFMKQMFVGLTKKIIKFRRLHEGWHLLLRMDQDVIEEFQRLLGKVEKARSFWKCFIFISIETDNTSLIRMLHKRIRLGRKLSFFRLKKDSLRLVHVRMSIDCLNY